jgi:tetratricopeptide (TPR) repeat protein
MGQVKESLQAYDRLLALEPANYATHLKKAEILMKEKRNEEAIQELMLTGYLSKVADKLWQAVKAFRDILTIDRNAHLECYYELGKLYEKLGKSKEAVAAYKKHVQKNVKCSNFGEAIQSCNAILKLEPGNKWVQEAKPKIMSNLIGRPC